MLFLSGATGKLGRLVLEAVLRELPAEKVRVMARQPEHLAEFARRGVEVVKADYDQPDSLKAALKGIHTALLISSNQVGRRAVQHQAFLAAACKNAVARLVYTSLLRADVSGLQLAEEHWATEEAIRHAGIPTTILRNGWYFENYTDRLAQLRPKKALVGATREGRISAASRQDYADAAAHVLLGKGGVGGTHELAGDASFTLAELAHEVGRQLHEPWHYTDLDPDHLRETYLAAGMVAPMAEALVNCDVCISRGDLAEDGQKLSHLLGRPTTTLEQAVTAGLQRTE